MNMQTGCTSGGSLCPNLCTLNLDRYRCYLLAPESAGADDPEDELPVLGAACPDPSDFGSGAITTSSASDSTTLAPPQSLLLPAASNRQPYTPSLGTPQSPACRSETHHPDPTGRFRGLPFAYTAISVEPVAVCPFPQVNVRSLLT